MNAETNRAGARFAILLDGELRPTDRLRRQVAGARAIAADGGMRHADALALAPEAWVGDFDSTSGDLLAGNPHVPRHSHPALKAVSDGELAIERALAAGAGSLVLCGALGGARIDHALFHILLGIRLAAERQVDVLLTSGREEAVPLLPGTRLAPDLAPGTTFSIIPFSALTGLSIEHADWPLDEVVVPLGSSLTLSNVARTGLSIELGGGTAALVATFDLC